MALITEDIPIQNFDLIRDQIAMILRSELENQFFIKGLDTESLGVWLNRKTAISNSEEYVINIYLAEGDFSEYTRRSTEGNYGFNIDIYTNSRASDADLDSANKVSLMIGLVRYILNHSAYTTLGFVPGSIAGCYMTSFENQGSMLVGDADAFDVSSMRFNVRAAELQGLTQGVLLQEVFLNYKIENTDLGYKILKIN